MIAAKPRTSIRPKVRVQARIKLARLLEASDAAIEARIKEIEADPLFRRLSEAGVLSIQPVPQARFAGRACEGFQLRAPGDGVAELLDGNAGIGRLIQKIGRENFEACYLDDEMASDAQRAKICGISEAQARELREFMDRLYVRSEFQAAEPSAQAVPVYSCVAGVGVEDGRPVLNFFNREIWKGRYRRDEDRYRELRTGLKAEEAARVDQFLKQIEMLEFRQATLYRTLELLIERQADYLSSRDSDRRVPITQREVAARLGVAPSTLNNLVGNKSVETPWGVEIPMKALLPSRKSLMRDRLYEIALQRPEAGDDALRHELRRLFGATISRPSIIQYRKELGLGGCGRRGLVESHR